MKPQPTLETEDQINTLASGQVNQNYSAVVKGFETAEKGVKAFWNFLRPVRSLIGYGFIIGAVAAVLGDILIDTLPKDQSLFNWTIYLHSFGYHAMRDIGIGLIVSSIAVFGYEYSQHARGDFEQKQKLDGALVTLDEAILAIGATEGSKTFLQQLKSDFEDLRSRMTEDTGRKVMDYFFSGTDIEKDFSSNINRITRDALDLKRTRTPDCQSYLEYIAWLCKVVHRNARALSSLEDAVVHATVGHDDYDHRHAIWTISWPSTKEVAARLFAYKLRGLLANDSYEAISNVLFWENQQMDFFMREMRIACNRGVTIRRIFNLCNFIEMPGLLNVKFDVAKTAVGEHLVLEKEAGGRYQVRFFGLAQVREAVRRNRRLRENVKYASFGLYTKKINGETDVVRYRTEDDKLSAMTLSRADVGKYIGRFNTIWEVCEPVSNPFGGDISQFKAVMGETTGE